MSMKKNGHPATPLEKLIRNGVETALIARLPVAAEQQGDLLAGEMLKDEEFRQSFVALARDVARDALEGLRTRR